MPKIVPKSIQTCFELVLRQIFRIIFLPSVPWRVEFSKIFKKYIFKIPRMPKSVPKRIQTCFRVIFSKKFNAQCSMEGRVIENFQKKKIKKSFKIPKMPKIVAKSMQTCFEHVLGKIFRKIFAQFSMEGRVFKIFQKNQKNCKIPKMPKIVPKSIQTCFELVLCQIFRIIFLPSVPWRVEFSKIFKKNFSKFQKCPKVFPKVSKRVLNMFCGKFF